MWRFLTTTSSSVVSNVVNSTAEVVEKTGANDAIMNNLPIIGVVTGAIVLVFASVMAILGHKNKKKALEIEAKKLKIK